MSTLLSWVLLGYLAYSLFLVYYWRTRQPLPPKPLNVEDNLPLPWLAQTSTVFSLTGLFGAYLGIAVILGSAALLGLACGTVIGLFAVREWIVLTFRRLQREGKAAASFEDFLTGILPDNRLDGTAFALALSGIQCVFATSELLILRELGKAALGLGSEQATLLAVGVAVLGYFYLLLGGYVALFRTDRIQLIVVCATAAAVSIYLVVHYSQLGWPSLPTPMPGFWEIPFVKSRPALYVWQFMIAMVMGLGLLLASPDTWKRIYQVNKDQNTGKHPVRKRVLTFLAVGFLPYLVLLPVAFGASGKVEVKRCCPDPSAFKGFRFPDTGYNKGIFVAFGLTLIASFLSSFNGSVLASVHVALIWARKVVKKNTSGAQTSSMPEEARFYQFMMFGMIAISLLLFAGVYASSQYEFKNPWVIGNILMGGYAVIAGLLIGTGGDISRLPKHFSGGFLLLGWIVWLRYFASSPGSCKCPTLLSIQTVRIGVALCLAIAFLSGVITLYQRRRHD